MKNSSPGAEKDPGAPGRRQVTPVGHFAKAFFLPDRGQPAAAGIYRSIRCDRYCSNEGL